MATALPTALTVEETNHLRAVYLCYRVAPEAVRTYFDSKHHPSQLVSELAAEKSSLNTIKPKVLKQYQWDQLYPPTGIPVPTSKDFDITLLICLLRNMKPKTGPPPFGFDRLPDISHASEGAHLARIKYYRNNRAHSTDGKLSNKDFTDLWNDLKIAIIGLGGSQFGQEIKNAETISLDNKLTEILGQLTEYEKQQQEMSDHIKCNLQKINDLKTTISTEQFTMKEEYAKKIQEQENNMGEISRKVKYLEGQLPILISGLQEVKSDVATIKLEIIPETQKDLQEVKEDIAAIKNMKFENIPENRKVLIEIELAEWNKFDSAFIPTRAADGVFSKIKNNSCVTLTGNAGMGKTVTTRHVSLKMIAEGFKVIPITIPEDIVNLFSTQKKTLFVVDDLCGKYTLNQSYFDRWKLILETVKLLLDEQFCKIISSCRLQVYKDVKFKSLSIFNECECNMNSTNLNLTPEEITKFATKYFGEFSNKAKSLSKEYDYFPFLCSLYHKNKENVDFNSFCKNPFQFIGEEMDNLLFEGDEGRYKYCVLVLCVIHNNQLTQKYLTGKIDKDTRENIEQVLVECELNRGTSPKCLQKAIETLVGTFLTKDKDCYSMLHDKLFDYVSYHLGQKMIDTIIEHADSAFIRERFIFNTSGIEEEKVAFTINLPNDKVEPYIRRIIKDWEHGKLVDFFSNRNLKSLVFTDRLINYLNTLNKSLQKELVSTVDTGKLQDTPLIRSCYTGNLKLTKWILVYGVNVNQCRSDGVSALYMACQEGYVDIVRELLQHKPGINKCSMYMNDESPLYTACYGGYVEVVGELLQHGADINKCNKYGESPLYTACSRGYVEVVRELLQHKPDLNKCIMNMDDESRLYTAWCGGYVEVVSEILQHGADINKCNKYGESPLYTACSRGYVEVVRKLLQHKPDINKCTMYNESPLYTACYGGYVEVVRELLQHKPDINKCNKYDESPLYTACSRGYAEVVRELLQHKPDINKCNMYNESPLYTACYGGYVKVVRELLQHKPDINKCDKYGCAPLNTALLKGYVKVVRELLQHKPDINNDYDGWSPLCTACSRGYVEVVRELLQHKPDINKCTMYNESPLYTACDGGHVEVVRELLQHKPDINKCNDEGWSPLYTACCGGYVEVVRELLQHKPDINKCDGEGWSPLYTACCGGHVEIVRELLQHKPDINKCNDGGMSPLYIACRRGYVEIVRELLQHRADVNRSTYTGDSPLFIATVIGNEDIVTMLLENGSDVNKCVGSKQVFDAIVKKYHITMNRYEKLWTGFIKKLVPTVVDNIDGRLLDIIIGSSPLHMASLMGHINIVNLLLEKHTDINVTNEEGATPLFLACQVGHFDVVTILLKTGADINKCNKYGSSPLYRACDGGYIEVVRELLQHKPDINKRDDDGWSPLYTACCGGYVEVVRELLQHKPDINKCDGEGWSPLYTACCGGHVEIVRELLQHRADVNRSTYTGDSPLFIATVIGNEDIVTMLLENGSDVNKCVGSKQVFDAIVKKYHITMNRYEKLWTGFIKKLVPTVVDNIDGRLLDIIIGSSPLHMASLMGHINIVNLLLEKHTDINVTNEEGATPLFLACQGGHSDVVTILLKRGADVSICRKDGKSPSSIALENKYATITSLQ